MNNLTYDITDKDVAWMQEQYRVKFGMTLSKEQAFRKTHDLVRQTELIYRPITKQQVEQLKNKYEDIGNGETEPSPN